MNDLPTINRGVIAVTRKPAFFDWANTIFPDSPKMGPESLPESDAYLIRDDLEYHHIDEVVKKYWKTIMESQLEGIDPFGDHWPKKRSFDLFKEWFDYSVSSLVFDLEEKIIERELD